MKLKKAASILLLMVFLFNTIGYKALFCYLEQEADLRLDAKIKTLHELDSRLIAVKIPINLPYQTDWREFESIDGEMTYKGITYKYVKRKVLKDTLILLCIEHIEKSELQRSSAEYFEKVNDLASEPNKKPVLKLIKTDYYQERRELITAPNELVIVEYSFSHIDLTPFSGYFQTPEAPPRKHTS